MDDRKKQLNGKTYAFILIVVLVIMMFLVQFFIMSLISNSLALQMTKDSLTRIFAGSILLIVLYQTGYSIFQPKHKKLLPIILVVIPGLLIAINNFPISAFIASRTELTEPFYVVYYFIVECLSIGYFEEIAFRVILLTILLQRLPKTKKGMFQAVLISSAVFGLIHLTNLFAGAGFAPTIMQVGYSFLTGAMLAVVYLKTKSFLAIVLLHASYNFFGEVMFRLGAVSNRFDTITIVITVLLAIAVSLHYTYTLYKMESDQLIDLYTPTSN
ncbi:CPBP family intramembrane metalloprotease [Candidatus Izimaplasma bacterium]|nr:CPBP family intramembrane metalloprotease [Candidatus Izimaplasma bacterium]